MKNDAGQNPILQSLNARKSMRVFTGDNVTPAQRDAVLQAAFQAPTAGNQMLYTIIEVTEQPRKETLAELCDHQPFIATAPLVLVFLADCRRWLDTYRAAGMTPRAPGPGDLLLAVADAVIAAQNAVVAADALGLGSCYIGDILEHCEEVRTLLCLPEEVMPATMLVIGHPTPQQRQREKPKRFDEAYIVQQNTYRCFAPQEHRSMHEAQAKRGNKAFDFDNAIQAFCKRKYESDFSREMNRSARAYLKSFDEE